MLATGIQRTCGITAASMVCISRKLESEPGIGIQPRHPDTGHGPLPSPFHRFLKWVVDLKLTLREGRDLCTVNLLMIVDKWNTKPRLDLICKNTPSELGLGSSLWTSLRLSPSFLSYQLGNPLSLCGLALPLWVPASFWQWWTDFVSSCSYH